MISKHALQYYRGNNLPRARHQVLKKSSGCRALQAFRRTREAPSTHKDTGKATQIVSKQSVDAPRGTDLRVPHGGDPYRREGEN